MRLAKHKLTNQNKAVKIYERSKLVDPVRKQSLLKEISILKKLDHPNIVKFYESFETSRHVYLVTEYVSGPSLLQYLKSKPSRTLEEDEAKRIWKQVVEAVSYLHSKNITHRDIKLENVLLSKDLQTVKLIDFGFST